MKKRIISLLLALIMALSLLPVSVLAADDHTGQVHVTVENTTWAKADGAPWEGTLLDEWVTLKADSSMMSCIVDALTAKGYSQTGADTGYISNIESGKTLPSMTGFFYICEYLDISPCDFFDFDTQAPKEASEMMSRLKRLNAVQLNHVAAIVEDILE